MHRCCPCLSSTAHAKVLYKSNMSCDQSTAAACASLLGSCVLTKLRCAVVVCCDAECVLLLMRCGFTILHAMSCNI